MSRKIEIDGLSYTSCQKSLLEKNTEENIMKKKFLKKLVSLILVAAILLQIAPTALKAEASDAVQALTEGELTMKP